MSAAPKFTPGPWSCGNAGRLTSEMAYSKDAAGFQPLGGCGCCDSPWVNGATDEECEANARLIAAAPLLYETVQDAIWVLRNLLALTSNADVRAQIESKIGEFEAVLAKVQP